MIVFSASTLSVPFVRTAVFGPLRRIINLRDSVGRSLLFDPLRKRFRGRNRLGTRGVRGDGSVGNARFQKRALASVSIDTRSSARADENVVCATKSHVVVVASRRCFPMTANERKTKRDVPPPPVVIAAGGFFFVPLSGRAPAFVRVPCTSARVIRATRYVIKSTGNRMESAHCSPR